MAGSRPRFGGSLWPSSNVCALVCLLPAQAWVAWPGHSPAATPFSRPSDFGVRSVQGGYRLSTPRPLLPGLCLLWFLLPRYFLICSMVHLSICLLTRPSARTAGLVWSPGRQGVSTRGASHLLGGWCLVFGVVSWPGRNRQEQGFASSVCLPGAPRPGPAAQPAHLGEPSWCSHASVSPWAPSRCG